MACHVPVVPMDRGNNTTCTINLHGATIVSWRVNNQARLPPALCRITSEISNYITRPPHNIIKTAASARYRGH